jgi:methionine-S-sulfoxide reductase
MMHQRDDTMNTYLKMTILLAATLAIGKGCTMSETAYDDPTNQARIELASAPVDSDEAIILAEAITKAEGLDDTQRDALLSDALNRASKARDFTINDESPLPEGWPAPSLPGLVRVKTYPPTREARVEQGDSGNGQFMTLFDHIKEEEIAMTAPVVMEHEDEIANGQPQAMAFLYRQPDQAQAGEFGSVNVVNTPPMTVVSVGLMGAYKTSEQQAARTELDAWLEEHPEWIATGDVRVLGYNSPFMLPWKKYSEVQIPIAPATEEEQTMNQELDRAIFAGGCFWGVEHQLQLLPGVQTVVSGYIGGEGANPTYEDICTGQTGHAEAVEVLFDPAQTSYEQVARRFFEIHDPTQLDRQGPDVGTQYRSAVFYLDDAQKQTTERLIAELRANGYDVVTRVVSASEFFNAEDYHQDYLNKHPERYSCHVRVERFDTPSE